MSLLRSYKREFLAVGLAFVLVALVLSVIPETTVGCARALDRSDDEIDVFAEACRLAELGFYAEARKELLTVAEANPGAAVPLELQYLPSGGPAFWRELSHAFDVRKQYLAPLLVALAVIGWIGLRTLRAPRLDVQDFDSGATELEIGKGLAAMVEQSLRQLDDDQRGRLRMTMVAAPIATGEVAIPDIKLVGTPLKVVSQLVDWVVPKNVYTLSGFVQKPGSRGAGLTLTLANNRGMIKGNVTLWQEEFDPELGSLTEMEQAAEEDSPAEKDPTGYYLLAEPAAIWLFFRLKSLTQDRGDRNGEHTEI